MKANKNDLIELVNILKKGKTFEYPLESLKDGYLDTLDIRLKEYDNALKNPDNFLRKLSGFFRALSSTNKRLVNMKKYCKVWMKLLILIIE